MTAASLLGPLTTLASPNLASQVIRDYERIHRDDICVTHKPSNDIFHKRLIKVLYQTFATFT